MYRDRHSVYLVELGVPSPLLNRLHYVCVILIYYISYFFQCGSCLYSAVCSVATDVAVLYGVAILDDAVQRPSP